MISTYNEWDPLRRVVVGRADHANWPKYDPVFAKESEKTTWTETPVPRGPVPKHIIDEANEDLEILADTLRTAGAEVLRPNDLNFQSHDGP
jgi:glycine amidinotransferase